MNCENCDQIATKLREHAQKNLLETGDSFLWINYMNIKYKKARFIRFVGRRFKCLINIDDKEELCYVASSSNLNHYLQMEGKEILVTEIESSNSDLRYRAFAVKIGNEWIIIDLHLLNRAVKEKLECNGFVVETEKYIDEYRADLVISRDNKALIYEVKSVLCLSEKACFPMNAGKRCEEQLVKLKEIASAYEYEVRYVFALLSKNIQSIEIVSDKTCYKELFSECCKNGMNIECLRISFENNEVIVNEENNIRIVI